LPGSTRQSIFKEEFFTMDARIKSAHDALRSSEPAFADQNSIAGTERGAERHHHPCRAGSIGVG
jgi:hypothetical protein